MSAALDLYRAHRESDLERFRSLLRAMVDSDLPDCVSRDDYLPDLPYLWSHNPARAFLRLTDADQRKALQYLGGDNA